MGNTSAKHHRRSNQHKKQVHWKAADRPGPPGKPQLVSEPELTPDVVTIRWDPPRFDGGSPIIGYLCEHRRYGSPHWVRATPQLVRFTELSLSGLEPGWRYQFRISAENAVGLSDPGELSELLTVTLQRSAVTAPRFIEELEDIVVLENEKVEFTVNFLGQPNAKISWFKDGFEIFSSRRIRIVTENDKSILTIHQTSLSDEGEIKCTATNRAGHASTKAQLTLEAVPSIRLPRQYEDGLLFELEETIRLKVTVAGRPCPTVSWAHNNQPIVSDDRREIESTDKYSSLRIHAAERTDRGEYQVKAVNRLGEAISSFLVTVTDKPSPPGQIRVVMTLGKSVTLAWNLPPDDGGCKIGNYIVEYFRVGWDVWLKAATCRQLTTTIGDLIEGSEYKFRIKAESPYGISEPSKESDTVFIADAKRGILSPSIRSHSQPRDIVADNHIPLPTKRKPRSLSSTRPEIPKPTTPAYFYDGGIPKRPARTKIKSPSLTPEVSPLITRRNISSDINKQLFDRTSVARDLAYGSPEIKMEQTEFDLSTNDRPYHSQKLDEMPIVALKSTVNVIHYQNPSIELDSKYSNLNTNTPLQNIQLSKLDFNNVQTINMYSPASQQNFLASKEDTIPLHESVETKLPSPEPNFRALDNGEKLANVKKIDVKHRERSPSPLPNQSKSHVRQKYPSPLRSHRSRSPSPNTYFEYDGSNENYETQFSNTLKDKNDPLSNSSEFMLVLLPEKQRDEGYTHVIEFNFDENSIPPPMSLSAPELGAEELIFEPLRCSVSSSELLYENAIKRFQEFSESNETELQTRPESDTQNSNSKKIGIPKIQINSKDDEVIVGLERSNSIRRRSSGGIILPQQTSWNYRRHSLRNSVDISEIPENTLRRYPVILDSKNAEGIKVLDHDNPSSTPLSIESKREIFSKRQKSKSEEREEEVFEKVRTKMVNKKKQNRKAVAIVQEDDWDEVFEEENKGLQSDSDSSDDFRIIEKFRTRQLSDKEDEEIYHPGFMQQTTSIKPKVKSDQPFQILTKPIEKFTSIPLSDEESEEVDYPGAKQQRVLNKPNSKSDQPIEILTKPIKKFRTIPLSDEEGEEIYHSGSTRKRVSNKPNSKSNQHIEILTKPIKKFRPIPLSDEEGEKIYHPGFTRQRVSNKLNSKSDEPFEILTKPNPLPDPNFVPKPILKKKIVKDIPDKPSRKSTDTNTLRQKQTPSTNIKEAFEGSSKPRPFSLFPQNKQTKNKSGDNEMLRKRSNSPAVLPRKLINDDFSRVAVGLGQAAKVPTAPIVPPKKSDDEIKVVVDHYGDIVRSYGQRTRTVPKVMLNTDDLKAAAEKQSDDDSKDYSEPETPTEDEAEHLRQVVRRPSFIEASSALLQSVKQSVSAAFASNQVQDDIIPLETEIQPSLQRRGSTQLTKPRKSSKPVSKLDVKSKKSASLRGENWSNLRTPSPSPQGKKSSPITMRRNSLTPPVGMARRNSPGSISPIPFAKPKLRETTTQTSKYDDSRTTEELTARAEIKVRTTMDYVTDLAMFIVACWLYLFTNELLAIPVLLVMVYRQLKEEIGKQLPQWMTGQKKVKRK